MKLEISCNFISYYLRFEQTKTNTFDVAWEKRHINQLRAWYRIYSCKGCPHVRDARLLWREKFRKKKNRKNSRSPAEKVQFDCGKMALPVFHFRRCVGDGPPGDGRGGAIFTLCGTLFALSQHAFVESVFELVQLRDDVSAFEVVHCKI